MCEHGENAFDCTYDETDEICCPSDGGCVTTASPTIATDSPTEITGKPTISSESPTEITDSPTSTTTKTPTTTTETPTTTTETPTTTTETPTTTTDTPTTTTETPTTTTETPTTTTETPTTTTDTPTTTTDTQTSTDTPTTKETSSPTSPTSKFAETPSPNEETPSPTWPTTRPTLQSAVKWEMIHPAYEGSHGELLWNIYYGDFSNDVRFDEFRQKEKWDIQLVKPIIQNDEIFEEYRKELKVVLRDNPGTFDVDVDNASSSTKSSMSYGPMIFIVAVILLSAFGYWYKCKDGNNKIKSLFTKTEENAPLLNQQTTQYVY
jgi:hypothetical protein